MSRPNRSRAINARRRGRFTDERAPVVRWETAACCGQESPEGENWHGLGCPVPEFLAMLGAEAARNG